MDVSTGRALRLAAVVVVAAISILVIRDMRASDPLDDLMTAFLDKHGLDGGVVGTIQPGGTIKLNAYGLADPATGRVMDVSDRFRMASLSKPVTSAVVFEILADNPNVSVNSALVDILPELRESADPRMSEVTLAQMLQHSAGWAREETYDPFFLSPSDLRDELGLDPDALDSCAPVVRAMLAFPLQNDPGTTYAYSNVGYCWLALWIEQTTGQPYKDAVQSLVPEAAGLSLSKVDVTVAHGDRQAREALPALVPDVLGPVGGWIGSVAEFMPLATRQVDPAVLSRPEYASEGQYYGLGWRVWPHPQRPILTHYGAIPGVFSVVIRSLDGHAMVAMFNGRPENDLAAFADIFAIAESVSVIPTQ